MTSSQMMPLVKLT